MIDDCPVTLANKPSHQSKTYPLKKKNNPKVMMYGLGDSIKTPPIIADNDVNKKVQFEERCADYAKETISEMFGGLHETVEGQSNCGRHAGL